MFKADRESYAMISVVFRDRGRAEPMWESAPPPFGGGARLTGIANRPTRGGYVFAYPDRARVRDIDAGLNGNCS